VPTARRNWDKLCWFSVGCLYRIELERCFAFSDFKFQ